MWRKTAKKCEDREEEGLLGMREGRKMANKTMKCEVKEDGGTVGAGEK